MKKFLLFFSLLGILNISFLISETIGKETLVEIMEIADTHKVPRSVVFQLIYEESRFNPNAVNKNEPGGFPSIGLVQIYTKPENYNYLIDMFWIEFNEMEDFDSFNPIHSAKIGIRYLAYLHTKLDTWYRAVCAYNAGISKVLSGEVFLLHKYKRTRNYARRIVLAPEPEI